MPISTTRLRPMQRARALFEPSAVCDPLAARRDSEDLIGLDHCRTGREYERRK